MSDYYEPDYSGKPPLTVAAIQNDMRRLVEFLDAGADIEARDDQGLTALQQGAARRSHVAVDELLRRGADLNATDMFLCTALHRAAMAMDRTMLNMLVVAGADTRARNINGHTARDMVRAGYGHCLDELRRRPARRARSRPNAKS